MTLCHHCITLHHSPPLVFTISFLARILASSLPAPPECVKRDNVCVLPWFCVSTVSWAGCWSDAGTGKYAYQIGGYCFIDNNVQYIYTIPSMYLLFYLNS